MIGANKVTKEKETLQEEGKVLHQAGDAEPVEDEKLLNTVWNTVCIQLNKSFFKERINE